MGTFFRKKTDVTAVTSLFFSGINGQSIFDMQLAMSSGSALVERMHLEEPAVELAAGVYDNLGSVLLISGDSDLTPAERREKLSLIMPSVQTNLRVVHDASLRLAIAVGAEMLAILQMETSGAVTAKQEWCTVSSNVGTHGKLVMTWGSRFHKVVRKLAHMQTPIRCTVYRGMRRDAEAFSFDRLDVLTTTSARTTKNA